MDFQDLHSLNRCLLNLQYLFTNTNRITPQEGYERKRGGFGDVEVCALDEGTPFATLVVTKTLHFYPDRKRPYRLALRFARELRVWASLQHPHILPLLGYYLDKDHRKAILISDYMVNGDLKEYIEDRRPDWGVRLELARDIADGLQYLHSRAPPICHGDLKMGNILVNAQPRAVLADFGLSTILEEEGTGLTTSSGLKGTIRYYSPELILETGAKHSLASDIWAWGCLILETLTDMIPYARKDTDTRVMLSLAQKEAPASLETLSILSLELKELLGQCWDPEPTGRPSAAACFETVSSLNAINATRRTQNQFLDNWVMTTAITTAESSTRQVTPPNPPPLEFEPFKHLVQVLQELDGETSQWHAWSTVSNRLVNLDPEVFKKLGYRRFRPYIQVASNEANIVSIKEPKGGDGEVSLNAKERWNVTFE